MLSWLDAHHFALGVPPKLLNLSNAGSYHGTLVLGAACESAWLVAGVTCDLAGVVFGEACRALTWAWRAFN